MTNEPKLYSRPDHARYIADELKDLGIDAVLYVAILWAQFTFQSPEDMNLYKTVGRTARWTDQSIRQLV